jgi:hypothetical protein
LLKGCCVYVAAGCAGGCQAPQLARQEGQGQAGALQRAPVSFPQLLTILLGKACSICMQPAPCEAPAPALCICRHCQNVLPTTQETAEILRAGIVFFLVKDRQHCRPLLKIVYGVQGVDLSNYNFLGIGPTAADLEDSVKEDIQKLRASPLVSKQIPIYGFVYDVKVRVCARTTWPNIARGHYMSRLLPLYLALRCPGQECPWGECHGHVSDAAIRAT